MFDEDPFGLALKFSADQAEYNTSDYVTLEVCDPFFDGKLKNLTSYLFYGIEDNFPNVMLAGGSLRGLLCGEDTLKDYDLYFLGDFDNNYRALSVAEYLVKNHGFYVVNNVENMTTLANGEHTIQLSRVNRGNTPEDILDSFDINAARIAYHQGKVTYELKALRDNVSRKITFNKLNHPASNLMRIQQYIKRGYELEKQACVDFITMLYQMGREGKDIKMFPFSVDS